MKRLVDLDEIPVINQYIGNQNFVRLPDLEACPEVIEVEGYKVEIKLAIHSIIARAKDKTRSQIKREILDVIDSLPTPVTNLPRNQTYEDWLNETIDLIGKDFAYGCDSTIYTSNAVRDTVTEQANFIWQELCRKDDQIIKLERGHAEISKGYPDIIQDLVSTGDGLIAENEFLNKRIVELETKLANATRILLLQMKGETDV